MKKRRVNQILRGLNFSFNENIGSWTEEPVKSRYPKVPRVEYVKKDKYSITFTIKSHFQTVFAANLAQLEEERFFNALRDNFPDCKALSRQDVLADLLDGLD